jgi:hypothetical protein
VTIGLATACLPGVAGGERGRHLIGVVDEDRRAVLAADVPALAVAGGWVVDVPERVEQLGVADLARIERHLDRLGMTGIAGAHVAVVGVRGGAAAVANASGAHALDLAKARLHPPETAGGEGGDLRAAACVAER